MLRCRQIHLVQFRNYVSQNFLFTERVIGIAGPNGSGKTNLLDAIYYLCFTKSYFSKTENQNVKHGLTGFRLEGDFILNDDANRLTCILRETGRKEFYENEIAYQKFSAHIGKYPCVMIAPDDVSLISGTSDERRKFIDTILSQLHSEYLQNLIEYNKILQQRNSFLKATAERNYTDDELLEVLDEQLSKKGNYLFAKRKSFLDEFLPLVIQQYILIAGNDELISLQYDSQLMKVAFKQLLAENRQRDIYLQRTGCGVHKDDVDISMQNHPFKSVASQGQRKSLLFALKLAEFKVLKVHKGFAPILLLDDVFEKLDAERMHKLLAEVCLDNDSQVFITDTHAQRLQDSLDDLEINGQVIQL